MKFKMSYLSVFVCLAFVTSTLGKSKYRAKYAEEVHSRMKRQAPESFDARLEWPKCSELIGFVSAKGQGSCTGSWAFATASAISDRICINSKGATKTHMSAQDLLECCPTCGSCLGGQPMRAWEHWVNEGIATGGDYKSNNGCKPYEISLTKPPTQLTCKAQCRKKYAGNYNLEKRDNRGILTIDLTNKGQEATKQEIYENGPVVAVMNVYLDFLRHKGPGVYTVKASVAFGQQAVKIIGWGKMGNMDYWLCTNSLGKVWGDNGLFKILRGKDHSNIESISVTGGLAKIVRNPDFRECQRTDMVFVVDGATAGTKTENVVNNLVSFLDIPLKHEVGIVLCGTIAETMLQLGKDKNKPNIMDDMDDYIFKWGAAPIDLAGGIRLATTELNTRSRPEVLRLMIVLVKSNATEAGVQEAAQAAKQMGIWILVVATDSEQRQLLSRAASSGNYRFIKDKELGNGLPEDDAFYLLPLVVEENCQKTKLCWECLFDNGIYHQEVSGKCDQYYHCRVPGDTNPYKRRCPLGKFWDNDILNCVWPRNTLCWADPCVVAGTDFWPNPNHCGAYWQCNNSRTWQLLCCAAGYSWDQLTESCVMNSSCNELQHCFRERGCNQDFYLTFSDGGLGDLINQLYIDRNGVEFHNDPNATDGQVAYFNGHEFLTVRFYANREMEDNIQIYIRFKPQSEDSGLVETLVTDGGCVPLDPAVFLGYDPDLQKAYAYLRTVNGEIKISLDIVNTTEYIKLWYTYNGSSLVLESVTDAGDTYNTEVIITGKIRKTRNALKIGSPNYDFFGHRDFLGYVDEVSVSRCEGRN